MMDDKKIEPMWMPRYGDPKSEWEILKELIRKLNEVINIINEMRKV
jgi:hypothetical protein